MLACKRIAPPCCTRCSRTVYQPLEVLVVTEGCAQNEGRRASLRPSQRRDEHDGRHQVSVKDELSVVCKRSFSFGFNLVTLSCGGISVPGCFGQELWSSCCGHARRDGSSQRLGDTTTTSSDDQTHDFKNIASVSCLSDDDRNVKFGNSERIHRWVLLQQ